MIQGGNFETMSTSLHYHSPRLLDRMVVNLLTVVAMGMYKQ